MARQIETFAIAVPAGTAQANPATTRIDLPVRVVDAIEATVPPGAAGQVGFQLAVGGQQVIPYNLGQWVVLVGDTVKWPLEGYPESGAWSLIAYNLGSFTHTVYLRFLLSLTRQPGPVVPTPIPAALLGGPGV